MATTRQRHEIRRGRTDDAIKLTDLAHKTFEETYPDLTREQVDEYVRQVFSLSVFQRELADPSVLILIAKCPDLIGYALFKGNEVPNEIAGPRSIEMVRLFLRREAQGRGIGTTLLEEGLRWGSLQAYDSCWLKVWDQNQEAIDFYQKRKFGIVGATNYAHGGLSDRVLMMDRSISPSELSIDHSGGGSR